MPRAQEKLGLQLGLLLGLGVPNLSEGQGKASVSMRPHHFFLEEPFTFAGPFNAWPFVVAAIDAFSK